MFRHLRMSLHAVHDGSPFGKTIIGEASLGTDLASLESSASAAVLMLYMQASSEKERQKNVRLLS